MRKQRALKDWTGVKIGRLTAVEMVQRDDKWRDHRWRFSCECGGEKVVGIKQVTSGHTSSCGCLFSEVMRKRNTTHGLSQHKGAYRSWKDMRSRCLNPNDSDYADYGGRGIAFDPRWNSFETFFADMGDRPADMSLDRIDVNGNYCPDNCRWADAMTQANNKRSNRLIEHNGEAKTLSQWCRHFGLEHSKVAYRLAQGMSFEAAFSAGDFRIAKST